MSRMINQHEYLIRSAVCFTENDYNDCGVPLAILVNTFDGQDLALVSLKVTLKHLKHVISWCFKHAIFKMKIHLFTNTSQNLRYKSP